MKFYFFKFWPGWVIASLVAWLPLWSSFQICDLSEIRLTGWSLSTLQMLGLPGGAMILNPLFYWPWKGQTFEISTTIPRVAPHQGRTFKMVDLKLANLLHFFLNHYFRFLARKILSIFWNTMSTRDWKRMFKAKLLNSYSFVSGLSRLGLFKKINRNQNQIEVFIIRFAIEVVSSFVIWGSYVQAVQKKP